MKAEDSRQADTGEEASGRNSEGALHGAEADVTTRPRTKAEWEQENGLMDAVCERGNVMLLNAYKRAGLTDLELIIYDGARHEVFNETNKDEVMADLVEWIDARL